MDLRHTRTFVTVAELGTVSKAALQLRIAQPALSRQIGALEKQLGLKLFDRVGRRLLLTSAGEQLLPDCRALLNYAGALGERAPIIAARRCRRTQGQCVAPAYRKRASHSSASLRATLSRRAGEIDRGSRA